MRGDVKAYIEWKEDLARSGMTVGERIDSIRKDGMVDYADNLDAFAREMENELSDIRNNDTRKKRKRNKEEYVPFMKSTIRNVFFVISGCLCLSQPAVNVLALLFLCYIVLSD